MKKITIIGAGYVGLSLAVLLAKHCEIVLLDIDEARLAELAAGRAPIADEDIARAFAKGGLNLTTTSDKARAYAQADFIIVATPTDYDSASNQFDTHSVDGVVADALQYNDSAPIVIKSTIPVGHSRALQEKHNTQRILFSPEFLREGKALHDNLYPARIIIGGAGEAAQSFAALLQKAARIKDVPILFMKGEEAEAVKLFANSYLALRVAFFNELDSYALAQDLDTAAIIKGVSLDARIGEYYNNPSFGYGGYCLPKDTQQLLANYADIPQNLIGAVIEANETRKAFIAEQILAQGAQCIGVYRLVMKSGADNTRSAAIFGVIERLRKAKKQVLIYEPNLTSDVYETCEVIGDLDVFKKRADLIIANRMDENLHDAQDKIFTRDIFGDN